MSDLALAIKLTTEGGQLVVKDLRQIDDAADKVNHSLTSTGKSGSVAGQGLNKASGGADVLTGSLKSMLSQAAGVIALGFGIDKIASGMYNGIDAFQGYRGQLKTITGDFDSASVELNRLINLSKETPFTLAQSVEGFSKLTHLGLDPSKQSMISYGNTAAAMGKDLMQMIEAVADASVGEFERLKEFGIKASSQGDNVRFTFQNVSTTIKKDATSIQQYLIDLGNNKFGDAMGDQMGRLSSKSSNLQTQIAQLYNEIGNYGAADGIGDSIDGMASSVENLTEHLPEIISLLSTLTDIVMVGGVAYLGLKALPLLMGVASTASKTLAVNILATSMAYKAGVTPVTLFTGGVKSSTVATMEAVVATGLLKSAVLGLFAAYAGWEVGSYLSEQFVEVRVAGLSFVGAMETGLVNLSYSFSAVAPKAKQVWGELTTWLKNKLGSLYSLISEGLESIGADDMAQGYKNFADSLSATSDTAKAATKELVALEAQRKAEIETVDSIIVGLINHAYAQEASTNATNKNIEAKNKNNKVKPDTSAELTTNQKLIIALGQQVHMLGLTAKQKLLHINLSKLSAKATIEDIAAVEALTAAQYEQLQINAQKQDDSDYYQSVIDGANDISESWNTAGNVIVNTFGTIGEQLDKLAQQQESYANKQKKMAADKIKYTDDPKKLSEIAKAENALSKQKDRNAISEISSYRAITDSAASMFSENSKGRKAMQAASDVFTAIELANSALRIGSYAIEAITAAFAAPWPIGFASGAAMIAIMAGLGVAVSGSSGSAPMSSAERQKNQGTGTVLGSDDKSTSINSSFERIEELELDQYAELREMNTSLNDLNNNITHLAASFVGSFGKFDASAYSGELGSKSTTSMLEGLLIGGGLDKLDPTGIVGKIISSFSSTKKSLIDSGISIVAQTLGTVIDSGLLQAQSYVDIKTKKKKFWGASSSTSYNTEYQDIDTQLEHEMSLIFGDIGHSINAAVNVLGLDVSNNLDNFIIDLPNISFKDLSGDEIQAELEAIFSSQSDLMATYLVPGTQSFQQVGEGLYETLIRVAQEQAIFNSALDATSDSMNGIYYKSNEFKISVAQSIIELTGGLEKFREYTSTYFSEFFSEDEQLANTKKNLDSLFEGLNLSVPQSKDDFRALIESTSIATEEGQALYASLISLSPQMAGYYNSVEKQLELEVELASARQSFTDSFTQELEQLDMSPLQIKLANLQKEFDGYRSEASELGVSTGLLEHLFNVKEQQIIDDELARINANTQKNIDAISNAFSALTTTMDNSILSIMRNIKGFDESDYQTSEIARITQEINGGSIEEKVALTGDLQNAIMSQYSAELAGLDETRDVAQQLHDEQLAQIEEKYQLELSLYNTLSDAITSLQSSAQDLLLSDLSTLTNEERLSEAKKQYDDTLFRADSGDTDAMNVLAQTGQNYLGEAQKFYASGSDYSRIFDGVYDNLNTLGQQNIIAPVRDNAPNVPTEILEHNKKVQELQQSVIDELKEVKIALDKQIELTNEANEKTDNLKFEVVKNARATERQMDEFAQAVNQ
jgi:hypothetical protein